MSEDSLYSYFLNEKLTCKDITSFSEINLNIKNISYLFKEKECYKNSLIICNLFPEVLYVEGQVIFEDFPIGIEHAWNKYNDLYFDVTYQLFCDKPRKYYPIVEGSTKELKEEGYIFNSSKTLSVQFLHKKKV